MKRNQSLLRKRKNTTFEIGRFYELVIAGLIITYLSGMDGIFDNLICKLNFIINPNLNKDTIKPFLFLITDTIVFFTTSNYSLENSQREGFNDKLKKIQPNVLEKQLNSLTKSGNWQILRYVCKHFPLLTLMLFILMIHFLLQFSVIFKVYIWPHLI